MRPEFRFLSALLVLLGSIVFADEPASKAEFTQEDWRVAISSFAVDRLEENPELSTIIPRLIYDEVSTSKRHEISEAEKNLLAREILDIKELEVLSELSGAYQSRDEILFDPNKDSSSLGELEKEIQAKNAELSYWREYSPRQVDIPDGIPVAFPETLNGEVLWDVGVYSPRMYRQSNRLDMLIFGSVSRVGDYYRIEVSVFERSGGAVIWEGVGTDEDFVSISREVSGRLRELILGRQWASLTVQTEPSDAIITVNPGGGGIGYWSNSNLLPGVFSLEITATGHKPKIISGTLAAGEIRFVEVKLEISDSSQILIKTIPTDANLRLGNIWIGKTPMAIEAPSEVFDLTVEKDGHKKRVVPLYPDTERLTIPLELAISDPVKELADARKKLYNSIALFSFSLAPTVILIGVSKNYEGRLRTYDSVTEDYLRTYETYLYIYGSMWGSVAINAGFLTNVLIRIAKYFKAVESLPY